MITVRWEITGRVQGVGFRYFVRDRAGKFRLTGTVCNCPDGSVEVVVQGLREELDQFRDVIKKGNGLCRVDRLVEYPADYAGPFQTFEIIR
ncbi:MAG: acylphosphatase [Bacteroidetes bacterium]|nr:acylphosphatase [Bacteroidota bacterium]